MVAIPSYMTTKPTSQTLAQLPASHADSERRREIVDAWKAYKGSLQDPLKVDRDQPNDNVKPNRCGPIVDKVTSFLFGQPVKIEAPDANGEGVSGSDADGDSDPIQDYIDGLWGHDDDKMTLLTLIATNGGVCGQSFVKLVPSQDEDGYPRLVNLDPQLVRVVTAPDDCNLVLAYIIEYLAVNDYQYKQIISRVDLNAVIDSPFETPQLNPTWTIANFMRRGAMQAGSGGGQNVQSQWQQIDTPEEWPYPFAPIFTNQNLPNPNEFWGRPDLTPDLIRMNKVLNFLLSNVARIIKYHGHPLTWARGMRADQMQTGPDDMIVIQSETGEIGKLDPMDNFAGLLQVVADVRSSMDEQSRVPSVALGRLQELPKGNISGVALALLFQPLIELTELKRRLYGRLIRDVTKAALVVANKIDVTDYEDFDIELHWPSLLPSDDLQAAQTALILQQLGASSSTLLAGLGLDPDLEAEKKAKEDEASVSNAAKGQGFPPQLQQQQQLPGQPPPTQPAQTAQADGGQA